MAKELPYFKFFVSEWNDGDITLEDMEVQGLFINLCAYYWSNECDLTLTKLNKKFKHHKEGIEHLISEELIKVEKDNVIISFLVEQLGERGNLSNQNSINAKKRWDKIREERGRNAIASISQSEKGTESMQYREEKRREEKKWQEFSIKFYNQLKEKAVISKTVTVNKGQIDHIRKLEKVDKIDWSDITSGANYYFSNLDADFMPEIQSTKAFRDKFDKLVAHKKRKQ